MISILKNYGITTHAEVIPTGIEPDSFVLGDRTAFRNNYRIPQDRPVLLFVGRVAHEKNISFLLKVVEQVRTEIPDILFVIAGEGPAQNSLKQNVKHLGISENVMFIGYLDRHTELNNCYRSADIFIFASRTETQGLVLLEAMAQGLPVVSTAELGTRDVLKEGMGVWIAEEVLADFAGKVITMLGNAEKRIELGKAAQEYAQGWSASKQAERMLAFYQATLNPSELAKQTLELSASAAE